MDHFQPPLSRVRTKERIIEEYFAVIGHPTFRPAYLPRPPDAAFRLYLITNTVATDQSVGECVGHFRRIRTGAIDLLAKVCTHGRMKAIGVKIMVVTSATFDVSFFKLKKKKSRNMNSLVVF